MDSDSNSLPEVYKFSLTDVEEEKSKEEEISMEDDYIEETQVGKDQRVFRFRESSEEVRSSLSSSSRGFKDMESLRYYKTRKRISRRRKSTSNCYHIVYNVFRVKNEEEEEEVRRRLLPKHVHPKLPDYDQIAAQFKALRIKKHMHS